MKTKYYRDYKKGMGIIVAIPGDEHDGKQNRRPGVVIDSNPNFVTVQLFSSRPSEHDFLTFEVNNKKQYIREIYLKNILLDHVKGVWIDWSKIKPLQLDIEGNIIKTLEKNVPKVSSITLSLSEYLDFKAKDLELQTLKLENQSLKKEIDELKKEREKMISELEFELEY